MKKFICDGCEKHHAVESESQPRYCLMTGVAVRYDWREVTPDTPTKLTAEELARRGIEWPEEADGAVVHSDGHASFYRGEIRVLYPCSYKPDWHVNVPGGEFISAIPGKWDASDWKNSLIRRLEKKEALPDWCKPKAWVWINHSKKYKKIKNIVFGGNGFTIGIENDGSYYLTAFSEARCRQWTPEEAIQHLGKKFSLGEDGDIVEILSVGKDFISFSDSTLGQIPFSYLAENGIFKDGSPCGVLEHREGEG